MQNNVYDVTHYLYPGTCQWLELAQSASTKKDQRILVSLNTRMHHFIQRRLYT